MQALVKICIKHQNQPGSGGAYAGGLQTSSVGRLPNTKLGVVPPRPRDRAEVTSEPNNLRFEIPDEKPPSSDFLRRNRLEWTG